MLLTLLGCSGQAPPPVEVRPDLILVTLDTTRADRLGCYGHELADTPTLDALCASGRRYERAYSPVPLTIPSHAAIFTGMNPAELGIRSNGDSPLPSSALTLTELLQAQGYQTAGAVSAFVTTRSWGFDQGFDAFFDSIEREEQPSVWHAERRGSEAVDDLLAWVEAERDPERPLFAWLHLYDPHHPYAPPEPYQEDWKSRPYDGELAYVDDQMERMVEALGGEHTLWVVVGDHGEGLGDHDELTHGLYVYDSTQRVPFVISGPQVEVEVVEEPVGLIDLLPTVLSLLGIPIPEGLDGQAMPGNPPRPLYLESWALMHRFGFSPHRAVVWGDHKYIGVTRPELYDLSVDPKEQSPLDDPAMKAEFASMLAGIEYPAPSTTRVALEPELRQQLEALGYLAEPFAGELTGQLPDPKLHTEDILKSQYADRHLRRGELAQAEELLTELVADYPQALEFPTRLASVLTRQGRDEEAAAVLEAALERAPDNGAVQAALAVHRARQKRYAEATALFQSAADTLPWAPGLRGMAVAAQLSIPGEQEQGIALGLRYLEQHPDDHFVAGLLGVQLAKMGAPEARDFLELGVQAQEPQSEVALLLALLILDEGDVDGSIDLFELELAHHPSSLPAAKALITLHDQTKQHQAIVEVAAKALLHHPEDLSLLHARAQAFYNLEDYAACRGALDPALASHPGASILLLLDANLLSKEGQPEQGAKRFEQAQAAHEAGQ